MRENQGTRPQYVRQVTQPTNILAILACLTSCAPATRAAEPAAPPEAASKSAVQIADFSLRDFHGQPHSLPDANEHKLVVVAFLGVECPLAKRYAPRLNELAAEFAPRGVKFLAIDSNRQDSLTDLADFVRKHELSFPLLKDPDNKVADQFGATRVAEVFVLDGQRAVRYQGAIDDQYGIGFSRPQPRRRHLALAIEELLEDKPVSETATAASGCLIGRVARVEPHGDVTYSNQIARILNLRCVECHRDGEVAPFPLTNYDEVVGWADMIREVTQDRRMPTWLAASQFGKFANDCRLPDSDIELIKTWADNGAPQGDQKDLPEPPKFTPGWRIDKPDQVIYMSDEPFSVPAEGRVEYQFFIVDPGFKEDVWIKAAEARPGNAAVVHHHVAYFVPPGQDTRGPVEIKNQIAGYAPGTPPYRFPPGVALRIPRGSKIAFQLHYTPVGAAQTDRSSLGIVFADPAEVKREIRGEITGEFRFRIPPNDPAYKIQAQWPFAADTLLVNLAPHMHVRGKAFRFELEHPDGRRETLLDVPRYDFNWQLRYELAEPLLIRQGSTLHCLAVYDNSTENPANPDPAAAVTFGEQTWQEMMFGIFQLVDVAEREVPGVAATTSGGKAPE